eukprot:TRINITY_DN97587_c0_g1_i1.p1 TRINITY_DN97587_c0_g1~~TRINITY_DN97587_c0_g1_i1.p1  ORF type:complete len:175 (-),score=45.32 TRINITY_DN97587_c0_g1_i1:84-608(-)
MTSFQIEFEGKSCNLNVADAEKQTFLEIHRAAGQLCKLEKFSVYYEDENGDSRKLVEETLQDALWSAEVQDSPTWKIRKAVDKAVVTNITRLLFEASKCPAPKESAPLTPEAAEEECATEMAPSEAVTPRPQGSPRRMRLSCSRRRRSDGGEALPSKTAGSFGDFVGSMGYFWW